MTKASDLYESLSAMHIREAIDHIKKAIVIEQKFVDTAESTWQKYMVRERIKLLREIIAVLAPEETKASF